MFWRRYVIRLRLWFDAVYYGKWVQTFRRKCLALSSDYILKMERLLSSKAGSYHTRRRHIPEERNLRYESLYNKWVQIFGLTIWLYLQIISWKWRHHFPRKPVSIILGGVTFQMNETLDTKVSITNEETSCLILNWCYSSLYVPTETLGLCVVEMFILHFRNPSMGCNHRSSTSSTQLAECEHTHNSYISSYISFCFPYQLMGLYYDWMLHM
jgi:hypothetical protein